MTANSNAIEVIVSTLIYVGLMKPEEAPAYKNLAFLLDERRIDNDEVEDEFAFLSLLDALGALCEIAQVSIIYRDGKVVIEPVDPLQSMVRDPPEYHFQ